MKKKLLAMLLCICMVAALLPSVVFAASTTEVGDVTALQTALTGAASGDTIKLTADITGVTPTLTTSSNANNITLDLNGHTLSGNMPHSESTIALIKHMGSGTLTIIDSGSGGKIEANLDEYGVTIWNDGSGSITVSSGTVSATGSGGNTILNNDGIITVSGTGKVLATGDEIDTINDKNGTINILGGTVSTSSDISSAIGTLSGTINVSGGTVQATDSAAYAISNYTGTVTVSGGMVSSTSNEESAAIFNFGSNPPDSEVEAGIGKVFISGGTVQSAAGFALYNGTTGIVTVSGGTVDASGTTVPAINNNGTLNLDGVCLIKGQHLAIDGTAPNIGSRLFAQASTSYDGSSLGAYDEANLSTYQYIVVIASDLWVGGVPVTSTNATNITGDGISGTVSYDEATKTLTLNNATITGVALGSTIYSKHDLTVNLIGNNRLGDVVAMDDVGDGERYTMPFGIYASDGRETYFDITITGSGNLEIYDRLQGISGKNVTLQSTGTIKVQEYGENLISCCLRANGGTLTISSGTLDLYSHKTFGMHADNGIVISGGTITARSADGTASNMALTLGEGVTVTKASVNTDGSSSTTYSADSIDTYKHLEIVSVSKDTGSTPNSKVNSPNTGDSSNRMLWITLLFVSGSALTGFISIKKRRS